MYHADSCTSPISRPLSSPPTPNPHPCCNARAYGRIAGPAVRAVAGLIIKNNIRSDFVSVDVLEYVKQEVLAVIGDESRLVQATVGAIVTTACVKWGVSSWPDLLPTLLILADSEDVSLVEVGLPVR